MATMPTQIASYLAAQPSLSLVNVDANRNIFEGMMPDTPNRAVALAEGPGMRFDRVMKGGGSGIACENPMLQVKVRDMSRDLAHTLCRNIFGFLDNFVGTISGVRYLHIIASHPPTFLGQDEKKRFTYVVNFTVRKEIG